MRKMSQGANRVILRIFRDTEAQISVGLCRDLHGSGLRNNFGGQKNRKNFDFFSIAQIGSKRLPTSSTSLFSPKIDQFDPVGAQFEA